MRFSFNPNFGEISKDQKFILYDFILHTAVQKRVFMVVLYIIFYNGYRYNIMLLHSSDETIKGQPVNDIYNVRTYAINNIDTSLYIMYCYIIIRVLYWSCI